MTQPGRYPFQLGQTVRFMHQGRELSGTVARADRRQVYVLGDDRCVYRLGLEQLVPPSQAPPVVQPPPVELPVPAASPLQFQVGDRVCFRFREKTVAGCIARLNPKRALVVCDNRDEYRVSYALLAREATEGAEQPTPPDDVSRLEAVEQQAGEMLQRHGLKNWRFVFDDATRRAGSCRYGSRTITLSRHLARNAPEAEILDTLLHEIAHALVGPGHNHDAVWRAMAKRLGGSGERCHGLRFAPPRYIVSCRNGCWVATAERRRRHVVCKRCKGEVVFETFTQERWQQCCPDR